MRWHRKTLSAFSLMLAAAVPAFGSTAKTVTVPTSYNRMVAELNQAARRSSLIHISTIGYSAKFHRPILLVQLGTSDSPATRIMVLCRQHGDEPSGTEGALAFINALSQSSNAPSRLRYVSLFVVPMVNPDGAEAETRRNGVNADLNRDWGVFRQPETAAVSQAVKLIHPAFILDVHSWDNIDPFQQVCLEGPRGDEVAPNLLLSLADLQARAAYGLAALTKQHVLATTYGNYTDGRLAHRYFLRADHIASLLFETAPGPNYGKSLADRTALVQVLLNWLVTDTALHPDAWQRLAAAEPPIPVPVITGQQIGRVTRILNVTALDWHPFIPLGFGVLMLLWLALKGRAGISSEPKTPARYRRLLNTYYLSPCVVTGRTPMKGKLE